MKATQKSTDSEESEAGEASKAGVLEAGAQKPQQESRGHVH